LVGTFIKKSEAQMKSLVALCLFASIASTTFGQSGIRVHAFSQEIMPGTMPATSEGEVYKPKKHFDYQVFIECKRSVEVKLRTIRLMGTLHAASLQVVESPVVQFHPTTLQNDTLIQKTPNKLLKVIFGREQADASRDTVGVSFSYVVRGKKYFHRVKAFKELAPVAMP
jgi:hypothetical protein